MDDSLLTGITPKFGDDVFYDTQVLSAKVNSLVITASKAPEIAEELYLSALTTVCAYVENYLASHFSGQNSEYFERFCYSNIYGAEHRFASLKKLTELSVFTLNSVPQSMRDKNADIASAANRLFNICRVSAEAASAPVKYRDGTKYRAFKPSKRERLLLWELCGEFSENSTEKDMHFTHSAKRKQSAASPKKYIRLAALSFYASIFSLLLVNLSGAFILLTVFSFLMSVLFAATYAAKSLFSHRKRHKYNNSDTR
ncbi:MAG: hypothetical protein MR019_02775 [Ruminococcus sp.]|nr:hypothetical protein [Ruminococcus sp.]MDY3894873.1 hypothetical protein [Candidatus Fimenecus sp.]